MKTLYITDDDEDDLLLIKEVIAGLDLSLSVRYASNGSELLDILDKGGNDGLIFIDMNMPKMNGIEALEAVYADPNLRCLRSILMSTSNADDLKERALNAGLCYSLSSQSALNNTPS